MEDIEVKTQQQCLEEIIKMDLEQCQELKDTLETRLANGMLAIKAKSKELLDAGADKDTLSLQPEIAYLDDFFALLLEQYTTACDRSRELRTAPPKENDKGVLAKLPDRFEQANLFEAVA